ncbi:peroxisomal nicotinamide adenine dinucleotide carrier-like isoform X4 [Ananas comosus]|uniref:Peroxisomal nicotinamide adenine dinucleotide carrier-like isoform X4 n=1 Tax=Ananas comosus TaxID=4615 RepID=A0A6P5GYI1_ANACO|nr:peroxisomal nicotinamide adenine dinucleotide carrier-like isoform X4 [Ananas comosus]
MSCLFLLEALLHPLAAAEPSSKSSRLSDLKDGVGFIAASSHLLLARLHLRSAGLCMPYIQSYTIFFGPQTSNHKTLCIFSGSVNVLLTNPIWVLVTRMQTHTQAEKKMLEARKEDMLKEFSEKNSSDISDLKRKLAELDLFKPHPYGTFHAAHEIYREAGIKGFWKGLVPTLIMQVCNPSIQFMIYEMSVKHLQLKRYGTKHEGKKLTALEVFLLGALAKLGATISTYPLLVVKSRLQAKQEIGSNAMLRYTGTFDAIKKMIRYEGLKGFYKGMGTKIVQSVFAASVLFMVKEELVKALMFLADESQKILH